MKVEQLGGFRKIAAGLLDCFDDELPLHAVHRVVIAEDAGLPMARWFQPGPQAEIFRANMIRRAQHHSAL